MRIRYQPRYGIVEIELRDILGGSPFAKWHQGDERDIPEIKVPFAGGNEPASQVDLATAIFRHGPDFVDASSGKNPIYSCATCGSEALEEHAYDYTHDKPIPFVDKDGHRLCAGCFLGANPKLLPYFRDTLLYGRERKDVIAKAQAIIAKSAPPQQPDKAAAATGAESK